MDMATLINQHREKLECEKIFIAPNIPEEKLKGAINFYGKDGDDVPIEKSDVLLLVDNTRFGDASSGILITAYNIFYCSIFFRMILEVWKSKSVRADIGPKTAKFYFDNEPKEPIKFRSFLHNKFDALYELFQDICKEINGVEKSDTDYDSTDFFDELERELDSDDWFDDEFGENPLDSYAMQDKKVLAAKSVKPRIVECRGCGNRHSETNSCEYCGA